MDELNLQDIRNNKWRQGTVIQHSLKDQLIKSYQFYEHIKDTDLLVLYTQDCDLVHPSIEKEPFAEFFCVKKIDHLEGNYSFGKNPRKMHIEGDNDLFYEFDINKRLIIDRSILATISVEENTFFISNIKMESIVRWFSKKYRRAAFPDSFNNILKTIPKIDNKITRIYRQFPIIKRLLFSVDPNKEIASNENYTLDIYILLEGISFESDGSIKERIVPQISKLFTVNRIKLNYVLCGFEDEMTVFELGIYKVWDKEYITLKEDSR